MRRRRCRPWAHQWFLRLDDWRVMCTNCTAIKTERRYRAAHFGRLEIQLPPVPQGGQVSTYLKAIVAVVGAVAATLTTVLADDAVSVAEVATIVVAVVTALGVYFAPNKPAV